MKDPVKDTLRRFELFGRFERRFFATIDEAIAAYEAAFPGSWAPAAAASPLSASGDTLAMPTGKR
jgi:hypothetical protein